MIKLFDQFSDHSNFQSAFDRRISRDYPNFKEDVHVFKDLLIDLKDVDAHDMVQDQEFRILMSNDISLIDFHPIYRIEIEDNGSLKFATSLSPLDVDFNPDDIKYITWDLYFSINYSFSLSVTGDSNSKYYKALYGHLIEFVQSACHQLELQVILRHSNCSFYRSGGGSKVGKPNEKVLLGFESTDDFRIPYFNGYDRIRIEYFNILLGSKHLNYT